MFFTQPKYIKIYIGTVQYQEELKYRWTVYVRVFGGRCHITYHTNWLSRSFWQPVRQVYRETVQQLLPVWRGKIISCPSLLLDSLKHRVCVTASSYTHTHRVSCAHLRKTLTHTRTHKTNTHTLENAHNLSNSHITLLLHSPFILPTWLLSSPLSAARSFPPLSSCFPLLHHSFLVQHLVNSLPLLWSLTLAEHICTSYAEWALIQKALSADTACLFFFTWVERLFVIWLLTSGFCFTAPLALALSLSSSVCLSWVCLSFSCALKLGALHENCQERARVAFYPTIQL